MLCPFIIQVTFVGTILSLDEQQSAITYMLDDGSGQINVKKWHANGASDSSSMDPRGAAFKYGLSPQNFELSLF